MRWDSFRWEVPLEYDGDALFMQALVQTAVEQPWYLDTPRLGGPQGQAMYDYPCADTLDILLVKIVGLFDRRPAVVFNLVYVLSFPLAALAMLVAGRRLGLGWPAAIAAAVLFAFIPYHAMRGQRHLFLATYFPVPLTVTVLVELAMGGLPFFPETEPGPVRFRVWDRDALWAVLIILLTGMTNPYYGFFTLLLLLVAGLVDALTRRRWPGLISAMILFGILAAAITANCLPSIVYQWGHGTNVRAHLRGREEPELYGLKLSHLVLPTADHRSDYGRSVERFYHAEFRPLENENRFAALGAVAAAGFVALLIAVLVQRRFSARTVALARLNLAAYLIGVLGGGGVLISLAYAQFRAYNRISIFIGCFALLTVAGWIDVGLKRPGRPAARAVALALLTMLVAFGVWDGATRRLTPLPAVAQQWDADAAFVRQVEERLPPNALVFQLPVSTFPETPAVHDLSHYRSLVGYLHSERLRWSAGAMRGRPPAAWQAEAGGELQEADTLEVGLAELKRAGFHALWIDWSGYDPDERAQLRDRLTRRLGEPIATRPDGQTSCYRLDR
ncbi:MAG: hypothetical protein ACJ8F7_05455 [Gemmataceae bacterium]